MNIIIIGCGKLGKKLMESLIAEGHNITIVDENPQLVNTAVSTYDVQGIEGNGASYQILQEAGVDSADLLIAVTNSDELNLLCCMIAKKAGNCPTIARVRNPVYREEIDFIKESMGLDMIINPEYESAAEMSRVLRRKSVIDINPFSKGRMELMSFRVTRDNILDGMPIYNIQMKLKCDVLITAVERDNGVTIPSGGFVLRQGDVVSMLAAPSKANEFFRKIGMETRGAKTCLIIGGGTHAFYLAQFLLSYGMNVKIVEKKASRCDELSILLPKAVIINADGTDQNLLMEEGLQYTDAFVSLTNVDEENILLSLYAAQNTNTKIVTKVNRINFNSVINSLELGTVIYPQNITADTILRYVRARNNSRNKDNVETLYHIIGNQAEALEFNVNESSFIINTPLVDLRIKPNTLVGCISRGGRVFLPRGKDSIQVGDSVVIVTTIKGVSRLQDFFTKA